jgi:hypothetical protein
VDSKIVLDLKFDDSNCVASDLPCIQCQYNLRTQSRDSECPECSAPIKASTDIQYLATCDPVWLRSVVVGIKYIVASPFLAFILIVIQSIVPIPNIELSILFGVAIYVAVLGVVIRGSLLVSVSESGPRSVFADAASRSVLRMAAMGSLVAIAIHACVLVASVMFIIFISSEYCDRLNVVCDILDKLGLIAAYLQALSVVVGSISATHLFRQYAGMLPSLTLAKYYKNAMYYASILYVLFALSIIVRTLAGRNGYGYELAQAATLVAIILLVLVLGMLYICTVVLWKKMTVVLQAVEGRISCRCN